MPSRPPIALCFLIFNKVFGIFVNIIVINGGEMPEFTPNEEGTLNPNWDNPLLESMYLNMESPLILHDGS